MNLLFVRIHQKNLLHKHDEIISVTHSKHHEIDDDEI